MDWTLMLDTSPAPRTVTSLGHAEQAIGRLRPGCRVIGLTKGQFSLLDLIRAVLDQTGPASVVVSTWTTGIKDAEVAKWLLEGGQITTLRFLTDRSFPSRQPAYCRKMVALFGEDAILCTRVHAKFAIIRNDDWSVVIRSSMNLNRNKRFEQFDLDESAEIAAFFEGLVEDIAEQMDTGFEFSTAECDDAMDKVWGRPADVLTSRTELERQLAEKRESIEAARKKRDRRRLRGLFADLRELEAELARVTV